MIGNICLIALTVAGLYFLWRLHGLVKRGYHLMDEMEKLVDELERRT